VADIGGTNARFGLVAHPGGKPERVRVLAGQRYPGLAEAALDYLAGVRPGAACLAVAGPVTGGRFTMNNSPWHGSAEELRSALGAAHLELVNDFEALALSIPQLSAGDLRPIGGAAGPAEGPVAVLGPGTGLGAALLVPTDRGWRPVPGEGGHVDLAPVTDREAEVVRLLRAECGSGSAELILSGPGLARLHRLLALLDGTPAEPLTAADICARRDDSRCAATLDAFCALLGSFAGNAALTMGARGGVHLGGGILPRIADVLDGGEFRRRFEAKPPVEDYLRTIPTSLIVAPTPGLAGAAYRLECA
jgi:glucokinase